MSDLQRFTTAELEQMHSELYKSATGLYDRAGALYDRARQLLPRPSLAEHAALAAAAREQHELMSAVYAEINARRTAAGGTRG